MSEGRPPREPTIRQPEIRATIAVVVLAIAGVIALWPRGQASSAAVAAGSGVASGEIHAAEPSEAELATARHLAALRLCPVPAPAAPAPAGPLAGITVPCLGAAGLTEVASSLSGRPALLNVWASWCAPCRAEIPVLQAYSRQPAAITVLGVNVSDRPTDALALLAALDADYPSVSDPELALRRALGGPPVLPASYLLRPDGSVQPIVPSVVFGTVEQVQQVLARYLAPP